MIPVIGDARGIDICQGAIAEEFPLVLKKVSYVGLCARSKSRDVCAFKFPAQFREWPSLPLLAYFEQLHRNFTFALTQYLVGESLAPAFG